MRDTGAQDSARTFEGGVTGSTPAGRLKAEAWMNDPAGADADIRARRSAADCAGQARHHSHDAVVGRGPSELAQLSFNGDGPTCGRQASANQSRQIGGSVANCFRIGSVLFVVAVWSALPALSTARTQFVAPPKRAHHALVYDGQRQRVLLTGGNVPIEAASLIRHSTISGRSMECAGRRSRHPGWRCGGCASPSILGDDASYRSAESATAARYPTCAFSRMMCGRLWASTARCPLPRRGLYTTRDATGSSPSVGHRETAKRMATHGSSPAAHGPRSRRRARGHGRAMRWYSTNGAGEPSSLAARARMAGSTPPRLGDVWEFDGRRWSAREFANGPGPRTSPGAAYDSKRGVTVVSAASTAAVSSAICGHGPGPSGGNWLVRHPPARLHEPGTTRL